MIHSDRLLSILQDEKKQIAEERKKDEQLQTKASISVPLVPEDDKDILVSKRIHFASNDPTHIRKSNRKDVKTRPLFGGERTKLQLAKLRMDSGMFRGSGLNRKGSGSLNSLRTRLGVETKKT